MRRPWSSTTPRRILALGAIAASLTALAYTSSASGGSAKRYSDPLRGWSLYRYHNTPAAFEVVRFRARHNYRDATLMQRIAAQPIATWFTDRSANLRSAVGAITSNASRHDKVAVVVAYDIPGQGCTIGPLDRGAPTSSAYLHWIQGMAEGIGRRRTIVILEPDALPFAVTGCPIQLSLLRSAVALLAGAPGARVYIDAGNASWIKSPALVAHALQAAGVGQAAGFSLNVSNFQTDGASVAYGQSIATLLGGTHFVIDTSRNGNGPDVDLADEPRWCNPPGRALGHTPTTNTHIRWLDAYLWIKPPGASDDACRPGEPAGGQWWQHYALELAANAR